jgi:hypothetical protein
VEEIQSPLVREIERSRRSLPLWVQGAAAVALLLLAGIFYSAMQEWRRQAEERGARLEAVQASYDENLRTLTVARATLEQEREALGDYVTDLETRLEARRAQAERFFERARAYREMLIAAGFNPDLIPLESDGATPEGGAGAGRDEETAARTRGGAPGRTDGTGPALTP